MPDPCVISGITAATMVPGDAPYGLLEQAAIVVRDGMVDWVGPLADLPAEFHDLEQARYDGRLVTPALIDCHTHIVHGGNRAREFELRLNGASYEEVARAGGGIASTVQATRAASQDALLASALTRVDALIAQGVAMVEVKSGYGLDLETELKMLRVARRIEGVRPIRVRTSFLGAHAVPEGIDPDHYIDTVCLPALEACHAEGLVDAVDGFCEGIAFDTAQIARVFNKARDLGLAVKLHAEQLSHIGGTALAADYGAISADHVEYATAADAAALARAGTVAVLLPGALDVLHGEEGELRRLAEAKDNSVMNSLLEEILPEISGYALDYGDGQTGMGGGMLSGALQALSDEVDTVLDEDRTQRADDDEVDFDVKSSSDEDEEGDEEGDKGETADDEEV